MPGCSRSGRGDLAFAPGRSSASPLACYSGKTWEVNWVATDTRVKDDSAP
jgi:hypothetical protein